jgi:hypothetical protein
MKKFWQDYNLSIVLATLFLAAWAAQTWTGWVKFSDEQLQHGQAAQWFGSSGYIWEWASATMENWQSEFLQLLAFVVLTSFLIHRGSPESKDGDDRMEAQLDRIEKRLERIEIASRESAGPLPNVRNGSTTPAR